MYDPSGRLLLIPPRTERRERRIFGTHIHLAYYNACIACTCVDIILILLALLGYFYPNPFRRSPLYNQIFQKIDRFLVQFWYSIALLLLALFLLFHIASLGFSLFSIQTRRPWLFVPQLVLCLLLVLLLLCIVSVCTTISIVSDDSMWFCCVFALLFIAAYGVFLSLSVLSLNQLLYESEELKRMMASSKSVHFKEKGRRRK